MAFRASNVPVSAAKAYSSANIFAEDYREEPYWWMAAPPDKSLGEPGDLNGASADVVIVGSGITGLVASLHLARGGANVLVLDAGVIGSGASRMNAGFLGRTLKRSTEWLDKHHGPEAGVRVYRELDEALREVADLASSENISCYHRTCGRYIAANSASHLRSLVEDLAYMKKRLGFDYHVIDPSQQHEELASEQYVGGVVVPEYGSLHPGLYHEGLVQRAIEAGVRFQSMTEVLGVESDRQSKLVHTARGTVTARFVVIATNGYTSNGLAWFKRRLVPFRGYVLATEILPSELIDKVLPHRRTYLDTKMNIDFIRPAPDSERILFGGMTGGLKPTSTARAPALYKRMIEIMPDLEGVRLSHSWTGFCAGTFDFMPHMGERDGVYYGLGYNFAGVPIGTMFGRKIAGRILGKNDTESAFDAEKFPSAPFSTGLGMVAPLAMRYFHWHDRRISKRH